MAPGEVEQHPADGWAVVPFPTAEAFEAWLDELAERLIAEGRMRPAGLAQVAAAKADGRWGSS